MEIKRLGRSILAILLASKYQPDELVNQLGTYMVTCQRQDGGWADTEETCLSVATLRHELHDFSLSIENGLKYLEQQRNQAGGWGRHARDQVRIPTTALVITLVPEVATEADWAWLRNEWQHDLEKPVKLSYKGGFYLLAEQKEAQTSLPEATIRFLEADQNDDGGFGPWRDHPIGSDPWSTGVVLWGLSRWIDRVDETVIEKALAWLQKTQLPSGYWPYHYLDEGTSYALIGAVSALKALQRF